MCLGMGEVRRKVWGVWGKVRRDVRGVKKCGGMCERVHGISVESVRKCVGVWESYGGGGSWIRGSWSQGELGLGSWNHES